MTPPPFTTPINQSPDDSHVYGKEWEVSVLFRYLRVATNFEPARGLRSANAIHCSPVPAERHFICSDGRCTASSPVECGPLRRFRRSLYGQQPCAVRTVTAIWTVAVRPAALWIADRYGELEAGHLCVNRVFLANQPTNQLTQSRIFPSAVFKSRSFVASDTKARHMTSRSVHGT
jgi:hypothetical protein